MNGMPKVSPMASPDEIRDFLGGDHTPYGGGMASPEEVGAWAGAQDDEDKYGGVTGGLKAAGMGALRGATIGASDVALSQTGLVDPKTIEGLQRVNPVSSFAGEAAGTVGSMMLGNEAAPANAIAKAGKATFSTTRAAIKAMQIADEGTQAAKILGAAGNIVAHAAGSAVEGAAFAGIGNTLNEYAIGDPSLNGEKIMDNFGKGALWGGALGAALKTAAIAVPPAVSAAKEGLAAIRDLTIGTGVGDNAGLIGKLAPNSKFTEALGNRMTNLNENQQLELLNKTAGELNTVHKNTQTAVKDLNQNLRPQEIDALINTADPKKVQVATFDIVKSMERQMNEMEKNPGLYSPQAIAKLDQWQTQITNNLSRDPAEIFNTLKEVKQGLGNWGYGIMDPTKGDTKNVLTGLSNMISDRLKDPDIFGFVGSSYEAHDSVLKDLYQFVAPTGKPTQRLSGLMTNVGTKTKPDWTFDSTKIGRMFKTAESTSGSEKIKALNEYFEVLKQLPEHLENTHANVPNSTSFSSSELNQMLEKGQQNVGEAGQKYLSAVKNQKGSLGLRDMLAATVGLSHPIIGAAYEAYNISKHPFQYMNALAEVERMVGKTTEAINKGASSVFEPTLKVIGKSKGPIVSTISADDHDETRAQLTQLMNDPDQMITRLEEATGDLHNVAPDTASGLQQTMMSAARFLQSKIPSRAQTNPFEAPYEPSKSELSVFNRYVSIVNKPTSVFDLMSKRLIGPEAIETLNAVYPKLYDQMKQSLTVEMTKKLQNKEPIPYQVKQQIGFFLGQPIDSSLDPHAILANQVAMQRQQHQGQQGEVKKSGAEKMTVASRTGVQRERDKA